MALVRRIVFYVRLWKWRFPQRALRGVWRVYKGRLWCRQFHGPVLCGLGGYGGVDHLFRRRGSYKSVSCLKCGNAWDETGGYKPHGAFWLETRTNNYTK
jgi:hypothetical protein